MPEIKLNVSWFIESAFGIARSKYNDDDVKWISLSGRLGGPVSTPGMWINLQKIGQLDLLLRCLEDDLQERRTAQPDGHGLDFAFTYQKSFSELWIGACYEVLRAIRQREEGARKAKLQTRDISATDAFKALFADLERLRMPLEKYEIAKDSGMKTPLRMKPIPVIDGAPDDCFYDNQDPNRSHIMPTGISGRGSVMWLAVDHATESEYWVERRQLAERMLQLVEDQP